MNMKTVSEIEREV